ncbi:MAG: ImmA/IrrE family metallo-endopeptidase [Bdellovibrionales bacterium]
MIRSFIPPSEIEVATQEFLNEHHPEKTIPIPVEDIIEINLGINIVPTPGMMDSFGIDAMFAHDFSQINIDEHQFNSVETRARFTLAHELGHYVLHRQYVEEQKFEDTDQWKKFVLSDLHREPLETQANMFASTLLMPTDHVESQFEAAKQVLAKNPTFANGKLPDDVTLAPYLAKDMARAFNVSEETATWRVERWLKTR